MEDDETAGQVDRNLEIARELTRDLAESPRSYPDKFVVIPLEDEAINQLLTGERARILRVLRDAGPFETVAGLARTLERDPTRVGRDLDLLEGAGLVETERVGRSRRVEDAGKAIVVV